MLIEASETDQVIAQQHAERGVINDEWKRIQIQEVQNYLNSLNKYTRIKYE